MGEKIDEAKGKAKQAAGDLSDDEELRREGKRDEAGAKVKEKVNDAVDSVKEKLDRD